MSELPDYEGGIAKPDFHYITVDPDRALNRIANIAEAEEWSSWEIREAVRMVFEEGVFTEKRPAYFMNRMRRGLVVAAGENSGVRFGDAVMFSYRLSAFWGSGWVDCPRIDSKHILCLGDSGTAVTVDSDMLFYKVPKGAVLGRFKFDGVQERKVA